MRVSRARGPRRRLAALLAGAAAALVAGVWVGAGAGGGGGEPPAPPRAPARTPERDLRREVGALLVSSFAEPALPAYLRRRLRAGQSAGAVLFGRNVTSAAQLRRLTGDLQAAARGRALVLADQEGGAIRTVPFAGPAAGQAARSDPAVGRAAARSAATGLRRAGVNVNLAPIADVPAGPGSVVSGRAFAGPADAIARSVRATVRGYGEGRVAATAKHFPGLGRAVQNTDDAPVTIAAPRAALEARDLRPFRAAVAARVPLVMASHALYPSLDGRRIASQSRPVLIDLLRGEMGFRGVVVTDSIEAQAVLDRSSVAVAAERSVEAGADLVLMTGPGSWNAVYPRLLRRARRDRAFRARVLESAARVRALGIRLGRGEGR